MNRTIYSFLVFLVFSLMPFVPVQANNTLSQEEKITLMVKLGELEKDVNFMAKVDSLETKFNTRLLALKEKLDNHDATAQQKHQIIEEISLRLNSISEKEYRKQPVDYLKVVLMIKIGQTIIGWKKDYPIPSFDTSSNNSSAVFKMSQVVTIKNECEALAFGEISKGLFKPNDIVKAEKKDGTFFGNISIKYLTVGVTASRGGLESAAIGDNVRICLDVEDRKDLRTNGFILKN